MKAVLVLFLVFLASVSSGQHRQITVVADRGFDPVAGATIQWMNTGGKQQSDENGHFKVNASDTGRFLKPSEPSYPI